MALENPLCLPVCLPVCGFPGARAGTREVRLRRPKVALMRTDLAHNHTFLLMMAFTIGAFASIAVEGMFSKTRPRLSPLQFTLLATILCWYGCLDADSGDCCTKVNGRESEQGQG